MSVGAVAVSPFASHQIMSPSAILVGSTGAAGRQLLRALLSESGFARTYEIGRRKTEYPLRGVETPSSEALSKLSSVTISNEAFENPASIKAALPESKDWATVFITLGTTRAAAGSAQAFEKIDKDYVINAAKAVKLDNIDQKLVYCSSMGADPKSSFLYPRCKGETEEALTSLGYKETIIFRPGMLIAVGGREKPKTGEHIGAFVMKNVVGRFWGEAEIDTDALGRAMLVAGEIGIEACLKQGIGKMHKMGTSGNEALIIKNSEARKLSAITL